MDQDFFPEHKYIRRIYIFILFMMSLTGFGQMPIFKRYYIADIPGLGWLAEFYVTHYIHYIGAVLLFAIFAYCTAAYFLVVRHTFTLTRSAYVRIILLSAITVTGIFRVLKNLPNIVFSPNFTMFTDISHLVFMMIFLMASGVFLFMKTGWLIPRQNLHNHKRS
ncbi:MAG: FeS-binding protein [Desulfobacterales bacterium]|nr:FeS-binding protein [Desulfobacterales bacterium]